MPDARFVDSRNTRRTRAMTPLVALPPQVVTPTRAVASLIVSGPGYLLAQRTEETGDGYAWPQGIDYASVEVPKPDANDGFLDELDVLELLDD